MMVESSHLSIAGALEENVCSRESSSRSAAIVSLTWLISSGIASDSSFLPTISESESGSPNRLEQQNPQKTREEAQSVICLTRSLAVGLFLGFCWVRSFIQAIGSLS